MRTRRIAVVLLGLLVLLVACGALGMRWFNVTYKSPPRIEVVNNSDLDLRDLVVEGAGFRLQIDRLPAHSKMTAMVHVAGESGLRVSFAVGSKSYSDNDLAYLEEQGGYYAVVTIDEALNIHARPHIMRFF
jgi:hypothetical protein